MTRLLHLSSQSMPRIIGMMKKNTEAEGGLEEHGTLMDGLQFAGQSHSGDWVVVGKLPRINLPLFSPTSCCSFLCFQHYHRKKKSFIIENMRSFYDIRCFKSNKLNKFLLRCDFLSYILFFFLFYIFICFIFSCITRKELQMNLQR